MIWYSCASKLEILKVYLYKQSKNDRYGIEKKLGVLFEIGKKGKNKIIKYWLNRKSFELTNHNLRCLINAHTMC